MFGAEAVNKVHGGDEARFGGGTADMREVSVGASGIERANDAPVERNFSGKIGKMEVS